MKTVSLLLSPVLLFACSQEKSLIQVNNQAPEISILFDSAEHLLREGNGVTFTALVSDNNEEARNLQVLWRTNDRVVCDWSLASEDGLNECILYPKVEDTILSAVVKDNQDAKATAEIEVLVEANQPPDLTVIKPFQGWSYYNSHPVPLHLELSDDWNEPSDISLVLLSSVDGVLEESWTISSDGTTLGNMILSEGEHELMIRGTDQIGSSTVETVLLVVNGPNTPPECSLPDVSTTLVNYNPSQIIGYAQDINVPSEYLFAEWTSDIDGPLGESSVTQDGEAYLNTMLSPGTHFITMTVSDEVGDTCEASKQYFVNSKPSISILEWSPTDILGPFSVSIPLSFEYLVHDQTDSADLVSVVAYSNIDGEVSQSTPNQSGDGVITFPNLSAGFHTISLTATDPYGSTDSITTKIHINTPPSIDTPYPTEAFSNTDLEFIAIPSDPDGDPVTISYVWTRNGQPTGFTTNTVPKANITEGDLWTITGTPNDGFVDGVSVTHTLVVQNSPPIIQHQEILPNSVFNDSTVNCSATAYDPDETVAPQYSWIIDGVEHSGSSFDLSTVNLSPLEEIICRVMATDSAGVSAVSTVSSIIQNRDPVAQTLSISPNPLYGGVAPTCTSTAQDPDGDSVTSSIAWTVNGLMMGVQSSTYPYPLNIGDIVECTVTLTDDYGATASSTTTTVVANTPPQFSSMTFIPDPPNISEDVICAIEVGDADGHTTTLSVDFQNVQTGATQPATMFTPTLWIIDPTVLNLSAGDEIACIGTVTDSLGDSTTQSISATFADTPPTITSVAELDATLVEVGDAVTCSMSATDIEDGVLTTSYEWFSGGSSLGTGSTYIVQSTVPVGSTIQCIAMAMDSSGNAVYDQTACTLENTLPTVDSIGITPTSAFVDSTLTCNATVSDPNGTVFTNITWSQNGTILVNSDTIDLTTLQVNIGDSLLCTINGVDEHGGVTSSSLQATIVNRLPDPPTVEINPLEPIEGIDNLVCQVTSGTTDTDGQTLTFTYEWLENGISHSSSPTVNAAETFAGDAWTCDVRAFDGTDYSAVSSAAVTILSPCFWGNCDSSIAVLQTGVDFVEIPNGLFEMGSDANEVGRYAREDQHYVYLSRNLNVMTTEVTQELFETLMGYNPSFFGSTPADVLYGGFYDCGDECPVEFVTWHEAALFTNRLTQFVNASYGLGLQECYTCSGAGSSTNCSTNNDDQTFYDCTGYRLPTEAEWEYMTKGSNTDAFNSNSSSGGLPSGSNAQGLPLMDSCVDDVQLTGSSLYLDELGWYCVENIGSNGDSTYGTKPVAQKLPNTFGLYDVYGNVREWTQDAYLVSLGTTLSIDPYPVSSSSSRVTKGGYWGETPRNIRSSARFSNTQTIGLNGLGFRVVQTQQ